MKRLAALLLVFALAGPVSAQSFEDIYRIITLLFAPDPYAGMSTFRSLLVPMGGAAEGLGTAATAMLLDASVLEFNPAASAFLDQTEVSLFHNNWIADTKIEGLTFTRRWGVFGLGFFGKWSYLPFTEYDRYGERVARGWYSETILALNVSWALFSSYYFPGISFGANVKTGWRLVPDYTDDEGSIVYGSGLSQSAFAISVDLGLVTRFDLLKFYHSRDRNFAVGLAVRNLGPPVLGDPLPSLFAAGFSYSPIKPLVLAFDYSIPFLLTDPSIALAHSWGFGASLAVTPSLALRAGFLLKGSNPRFSLGASIDTGPAFVVLNYTLDLATMFVPFNRLSVVVTFALGDEGRAELRARVEALYLEGLELYAKGDLRGAIEIWKRVLELDPSFDPAREGIGTAEATLLLQQQMEEIRTIDQ